MQWKGLGKEPAHGSARAVNPTDGVPEGEATGQGKEKTEGLVWNVPLDIVLVSFFSFVEI